MSTVGPQLDYAPADPIRRRKRRNGIIVGLGLLGLVLALWRLGPPAWRSVQYRYWLHEANVYALPSTSVVYDEDPARTAILLADPHYQKSMYNPQGWMPYVARTALPIVNLQKQNPLRMTETPLFLHSRVTPSGKVRLVVLWPTGNPIRPDPTGSSAQNQTRILVVASVVDAQKVKETMIDRILGPSSLAENPSKPLYLRIFAGQPDPLNAAHFTIPYELGDYRDSLELYLRDDDTIVSHILHYKGWQPDDPIDPTRPLDQYH